MKSQSVMKVARGFVTCWAYIFTNRMLSQKHPHKYSTLKWCMCRMCQSARRENFLNWFTTLFAGKLQFLLFQLELWSKPPFLKTVWLLRCRRAAVIQSTASDHNVTLAFFPARLRKRVLKVELLINWCRNELIMYLGKIEAIPESLAHSPSHPNVTNI